MAFTLRSNPEVKLGFIATSRLDKLCFLRCGLCVKLSASCHWSSCFFELLLNLFTWIWIYYFHRSLRSEVEFKSQTGGTVGLAPTSAHAHCNIQLKGDWSLWPCPHRMLLYLCFIYVYASHCLEELGGCINVRVVLDKVPTELSECVCLNKYRWMDLDAFGLKNHNLTPRLRKDCDNLNCQNKLLKG